MSQPLVFSYLAFSTGGQADGHSADRQEGGADAWAAANGFKIATHRRFRDEGVSRYSGKARRRGALSRFLLLCGTAEVPAGSILVIEDFDRLSRENPDDAWELFRGILLAGVEIVVLALDRWFKKDALTSYADRLLIQSCQNRAHEESKTKARRSKANWSKRREEARKGVNDRGRLPSWMRRGPDGAPELIPDRAATLATMARWVQAGMSTPDIAAALTSGPDARPCWLPRKCWDSHVVRNLLRSPALGGVWQPKALGADRRPQREGTAVEGHYPAVVEPATAALVRALLSGRAKPRGRRPRNHVNPLSGLLRDAATGRPLHVKYTGGKVQYYYVARQVAGRIQVLAPYSVIEALVLRVVEEWLPDALRGGASASDGPRRDECLATLAAVEADRQALTAELSKPGRARTTAAALAVALDQLAQQEDDVRAELIALDERGGGVAEPVLRDAQSLSVEYKATPAADKALVGARLAGRLRQCLQGVWIFRRNLAPQRAEVIVQVWPRAGLPVTVPLTLGVPPAGFQPTDVSSADFRAGFPAPVDVSRRRKNSSRSASGT